MSVPLRGASLMLTCGTCILKQPAHRHTAEYSGNWLVICLESVCQEGATAHYATAELDEGPIIAQATARATHRVTVLDLSRIGRSLEQQVLAQAVRLHLERRIFGVPTKRLCSIRVG
ncbi:MAG TPA: formyltransferase family protein [Nitrospiraceae bacterium]|nr:formyltransferase family protein [Nitrospiraceae bacterium]